MMSETPFIRNQFTFYRSFLEAANQLPKSHRGEFLYQLLCYGIYGVAPETLRGASAAVFTSIRPILDAGRTKAMARIQTDTGEVLSWPEDGNDVFFDLPTGSDKNKKENKNKSKSKNKKETQTECKTENEDTNFFAEANRTDPSPSEEAHSKWFPASEASAEVPGEEADEEDLPSLALRPRMVHMTESDFSLSTAVRAFLELWQRLGKPITDREQDVLADQLDLTQPWDRTAVVNNAISAQSRVFRTFAPAERKK